MLVLDPAAHHPNPLPLNPRPGDHRLSAAEVEFLRGALQEWWGPANAFPLEPFGMPDWTEFGAFIGTVLDRLPSAAGAPSFTDTEWARILFLAEMSLCSNTFGAGIDFMAFHLNDATVVLRALQARLATPARSALVFPSLGMQRPVAAPEIEEPPASLRSGPHPDELAHPQRFEVGGRRGGPWLRADVRAFLWHVLELWRGPASTKPIPLSLLGFETWYEADEFAHRMQTRLAEEPGYDDIAGFDLARLRLIAEFTFGSALLGAGEQFAAATGIPDTAGWFLLRAVMRKLPGDRSLDLLAQRYRRPPQPVNPYWNVSRLHDVDTDASPHWKGTGYRYFPYAARQHDQWWVLRANHCFPGHDQYTLFLDGRAIAGLTSDPDDPRPLVASITTLDVARPGNVEALPPAIADALVDELAERLVYGSEFTEPRPCIVCQQADRNPHERNDN